MTGWEDAIAKLFLQTFGSSVILGIVGILSMTLLIVVMKPPEPVAIVAVGLTVLLIAGSYFGGLGLIPTMFIGVIIAAAILYYLASKRVVRDY